jgi:hypothetical protein
LIATSMDAPAVLGLRLPSTIRAAITRRNAVVGSILSGLPHGSRDRHSDDRPSPAYVGRELGARSAVLIMSRLGAMPKIVGLHASPPAGAQDVTAR